ncbi:MAG TPA: tetratricopeptide repeat protein [Bellilinea sp.]|nr:tetratricopeptide repeat protein [Bellilinea sp.]
MPLVILAHAVVVPVRVLESKWPGGEAGHRAAAPNRTYRCDGQLAAVEFLTPDDVRFWIVETLEPAGLTFPLRGRRRDVAVVSADHGPTTSCEWLEFTRRPKWGEARLKGAPETPLTGPAWWSADAEPQFQYHDSEASSGHTRFIGIERNLATFEDEETGQPSHVGFTSPDSLHRLLELRLRALSERFSHLREAADADPAGLSRADRKRLREAALECERIARAAEPLSGEGYWLGALLARMASEWKLGERLCRLYLAGEPEDAGSWMELTWCLGEQGRHEEALEAARKAVALDPANAGAALNMAACLRKLGRGLEAMDWMERAAGWNPEEDDWQEEDEATDD